MWLALVILIALFLDLLLVLAWRRRKRTGEWPWAGADWPFTSRSPTAERLRAAASEWARPIDRWQPSGWRRNLPEIVSAGVFLTLLAVILIVRPVLPSADQPTGLPSWAGWIHTISESTVSHGLTWAILLPVGLGMLVAFAVERSEIQTQKRKIVGLAVALLIALEAQLALVNDLAWLAILLYLTMAVLLAFWWRAYGSEFGEPWWSRELPRRLEVACVAVIFLVSALVRLYGIGDHPYGIEGDESKWTVEVVRLMVDGEHIFSSEYHFGSLPVSFYMQAPFHLLLEPGIITARLAVAVASIIAGLLFYFLLRRTNGPLVALTAFTLLAISPPDVMASRLSNVESHVKLWAILPLFTLYLAIDHRRFAWFLLAGTALSLALITYDTLAPMIVLVVGLLIIEAFRAHRGGILWFKGFLFLLIPVAFGLPQALEYLFGRSQYYALGSKGWHAASGMRLINALGEVLKNISLQARPDFLFVRQGPLLEHVLTPFFLMGVALAILRIRSRGPLLLLAWFLIFTIPVPVVLDSPMFRVLYPGWPAVYGLIAISVVLSGAVLLGPLLTGNQLLAAAAAAAFLLAVHGLYVYMFELEDPQDRVQRRQAVELVAERAEMGEVVFTPYRPNAGHVFEDEQGLIRLGLRNTVERDLMEQTYRPVELSEVMSNLSTFSEMGEVAVILYDDSSDPDRSIVKVEHAIRRCFNARQDGSLGKFAVFHISASALATPECVTPEISLEQAPQAGDSSGRLTFVWGSDIALTQPSLECAALHNGTHLIDASGFELGPGWSYESRFAPIPEGHVFLSDSLGSRGARGTLHVQDSGSYFVWIRSFRREADMRPGYLTIGGETFAFSTDKGQLHEWVWERIGQVEANGDVELILDRPHEGPVSNFTSLFVWQVLLTREADFEPRTQPLWEALPAIPIAAQESYGGRVSVTLPPGRYQCELTTGDGDRLVDAWGNPGATSPPVLVVHTGQPTSSR